MKFVILLNRTIQKVETSAALNNVLLTSYQTHLRILHRHIRHHRVLHRSLNL